MLYIIGIGLSDATDITLKGLTAVKKCSKVYLESYTSLLQCPVEELSALYGKIIIIANREMVEQSDEIINNAITSDVAFLVIGDPLSATTHIDMVEQARQKNVAVKIIHNASVLTAIGETGLQIYKFGKVTSIPFENVNVVGPVDVLKNNQSLGLHTLFLLDLAPEEEKYLTIRDACEYLRAKGVGEGTTAIGCARLGSADSILKKGTLATVQSEEFGKAPFCLIIPAKMHFMEEEASDRFK